MSVYILSSLSPLRNLLEAKWAGRRMYKIQSSWVKGFKPAANRGDGILYKNSGLKDSKSIKSSMVVTPAENLGEPGDDILYNNSGLKDSKSIKSCMVVTPAENLGGLKKYQILHGSNSCRESWVEGFKPAANRGDDILYNNSGLKDSKSIKSSMVVTPAERLGTR
ncbi:hypothetical protein J6590_083740, partial [Homalodisca vitripennis]